MTFHGFLRDRRLARRAEALLAALVVSRTVSALASCWAEQMAFYRLLSNPAVTTERLARALTAWTTDLRTAQAQPGQDATADPPHLLLIQDTTEVSFEAHRGRIQPQSGLGWLCNNRTHGF